LFSICFPVAFVFLTTLIFPMPFVLPNAVRPKAKAGALFSRGTI
jgi:hypothetical protein